MKSLKMVGVFLICVLVVSLVFLLYRTNVADIDEPPVEVTTVVDPSLVFSTKDKLFALLGDVIGLDLSRYGITHEGYGVKYEGGGSVEVETYSFYLVDKKGGEVSVISMFYNGFPEWVFVSPSTGSLYYSISPPEGSVKEMKLFLERYVVFAQKYGITTLNTSLAFDLLGKAPKILPAYDSPVNVTSDDLTFFVARNLFTFGYTVNGINIPNRSWAMSFTDVINFHDTFGLYNVSGLDVFSEEELTGFAFDVAKKYCNSMFSSTERANLKWSTTRSEVNLVIIPGQLHNNPINNELLELGVGTSYSVKRDPLTLYPFLTVTFYFSEPIDNIDGVEVSVWGDTYEVASCRLHAFRASWRPGVL